MKMKKYTKKEIREATQRFGALTGAKMMAHNEKVDKAKAAKKA